MILCGRFASINNMFRSSLVALSTFVLAGIAAIGVAHGQDCTDASFCTLASYGDSSQINNLYAISDLSTWINKLFKFAIGVGAIAAVLRLAYAGYLYMGQSDMWSHKGQAREVIRDVMLGLLLLLGIWLILYQINPDIVSLKALRNIESVGSGTVEPGLQAGLQLQQQHIDDTTTDPQDYIRSVSQTPLSGQYCYPSAAAPGYFACLTNAGNCATLARSENASCTLAP
jgi:hypothetical protein